MSDYIEREAAIRATDGDLTITGEDNMMAVAGYIQGVVERLKAVPGRPKGKWERVYPIRNKSYLRFCSVCREQCWYCGTGDYRYCPNCGAEMERTDE